MVGSQTRLQKCFPGEESLEGHAGVHCDQVTKALPVRGALMSLQQNSVQVAQSLTWCCQR